MSMFNSKKRILVVEDEASVSENLQARLELEGYDVLVARDGKEGVEKARASKLDLIIMDVRMPKINGIDACGIIKADGHTKEIPVLILTALQTLGDTEDAFGAGADAFLTKPFTAQRLLEKVQKLLEAGAA